MPRKRLLKPSIFANEHLGAESTDPLMIPLFAALWCLADREGRLDDRPWKIVKGFAFPYRSVADPEGMLQWLHDQGFIVRYEVDGRKYIQIVTWLDHQDIHPHEARSVIPAIPTVSDMSLHVMTSPDNGSKCKPLTSYPSSTSYPSLKNGVPPPAADAAVTRDPVWGDGLELLMTTAKMTEAQARPFLGRLAKKYDKQTVLDAINVTAAEKPADPRSFLIGVLRERSGDNMRAKLYVGKDRGSEAAFADCDHCENTRRRHPDVTDWQDPRFIVSCEHCSVMAAGPS